MFMVEIVCFGPGGLLDKAIKLGSDGGCCVGSFKGLTLFGHPVLSVLGDEWGNATPVIVAIREGNGEIFTVEDKAMLDNEALALAHQWQKNPALVCGKIDLAGYSMSSSPGAGDLKYTIIIDYREAEPLFK
jgi:hypothetical protein